MVRPRLRSAPACGIDDVRAFFDRLAPTFGETHGDEARLLRYRLALIRRYAGPVRRGTVLEVGCGPGTHLLGIGRDFERAVGIDLSPAMIEVARRRADASRAAFARFRVDRGETLSSVPDASVDLAFCVGALEHMLDQQAVLGSIARVLARGGRFVCLSLNGDFVWYRWLAPILGLPTRHLATDRFLGASDLRALVVGAGLRIVRTGHWSFVPRGDMPGRLAGLLDRIDRLGRRFAVPAFRGGLILSAARR